MPLLLLPVNVELPKQPTFISVILPLWQHLAQILTAWVQGFSVVSLVLLQLQYEIHVQEEPVLTNPRNSKPSAARVRLQSIPTGSMYLGPKVPI